MICGVHSSRFLSAFENEQTRSRLFFKQKSTGVDCPKKDFFFSSDFCQFSIHDSDLINPQKELNLSGSL